MTSRGAELAFSVGLLTTLRTGLPRAGLTCTAHQLGKGFSGWSQVLEASIYDLPR